MRGWCPDAWHPMMAGDGLLVRVKPHLGRMSAVEVQALCEAALAYGNGQIDLTRRANFQIRGVEEAGWPRLLEQLCAAGLVDDDGRAESRRNILTAPDWRDGDDIARIADELRDRLQEFPQLPGKMGFVIDAGEGPALASEPGDFRIERACDGTLLLRADGRDRGVTLRAGSEVDALLALTRWFVDSGGAAARRMARHDAPLPGWAAGDARPAPALPAIMPGERPGGIVFAVPFARIEARALLDLMGTLGVTGLRLTPWRMLFVEGATSPDVPGLTTDPADPLQRVDACPGAPVCPQASVETRDLARLLCTSVQGHLHVSGCGKGCARSRPADVTVVGRNGRYDLAFAARADAEPLYRGLDSAEIHALLGAS